MQSTTKVKSPVTVRKETEAKIATIRRRLEEIRQYKRLIAEESLEPDQEDKRLESELIVRLLRLEKQLNPQPKKPARAGASQSKKSFGKKPFGKKPFDKKSGAKPKSGSSAQSNPKAKAHVPRRARGANP